MTDEPKRTTAWLNQPAKQQDFTLPATAQVGQFVVCHSPDDDITVTIPMDGHWEPMPRPWWKRILGIDKGRRVWVNDPPRHEIITAGSGALYFLDRDGKWQSKPLEGPE